MREALREISLKIYIFRDTDTAPAVVFFCWTSQKNIFVFFVCRRCCYFFSQSVKKEQQNILFFCEKFIQRKFVRGRSISFVNYTRALEFFFDKQLRFDD